MVRFPEEKARDFSVLKSFRARSSEYPASYSIPTEGYSSELRRPGREAYNSIVVPRLRINGAIPILPLSTSCNKWRQLLHIILLNITQNSFPTSEKTLRVYSKDRLMFL